VDAFKSVFRGKFITLNANIRKENLKPMNLSFHPETRKTSKVNPE